ncbi:MAG: carboxypeptidase M32 [Anaerolineae bacterium]|nr:carboxypeptidase M32 [Anaerolineales bacterium]MCB8936117.1 carboxypeptidase M32 [Promineifilum sp.]MCW5846168.1 carboxypeptidase M32 [Anaerolineae bacterium]
MPTNYEKLIERVNELDDLNKAAALLSWDREVNMPRAGAPARIAQMTTMSSLIHRMSTADEMGELIENAAAELDGAPYESNQAALIRLLRRNYADARKLPAEYVARSSAVSGQAREAWVRARAENDFEHFRPWLEQVVELCQEMADYYGYEDERYDALLDKYETNMKTAEVRAIFDALKAELIPLREAIDAGRVKLDDSIVHRAYDVEKQKAFARYIAKAIGYDFERGHLGTVVHPFATSFSRNDARITTRWYPDFLNPSLFGTLHECGHAMYEQGTHPDLARTPLARGTSLGIHESQSRMMENIVGRSRGFWQAHFPTLQSYFPEALGDNTAEDFYQAINKTQPSLIRVEADELTYNFHIILRFELEQAMLNGELAVADLPVAWNDKMQSLIGITPPNDAEGCLQDVHWSRPGFGYFPTYALGNLYGTQFYETAVAHNPAIAGELAAGKTDALLAWLRENIHQHGKKFTPGELVQRVTGQPLSHEAFMRYARAKFGELYQLN